MKIKLLVSAILLAFSTSVVSAEVVDLSGKGRKVILHQEVELDRKERKRVKKFQREATFYGAIAVDIPSRGQKGVGATWGYHLLETAHKHALKYCQADARDKGGDGANCEVIVSVVPATKAKGTFKETLSRRGLDGYQGLLDRLEESPTQYGAFAASNFYNWGWAVNDDRKTAQATALAECRGAVGVNAAKNSAKWERVGISAKTNKCRVIETFTPKR